MPFPVPPPGLPVNVIPAATGAPAPNVSILASLSDPFSKLLGAFGNAAVARIEAKADEKAARTRAMIVDAAAPRKLSSTQGAAGTAPATLFGPGGGEVARLQQAANPFGPGSVTTQEPDRTRKAIGVTPLALAAVAVLAFLLWKSRS